MRLWPLKAARDAATASSLPPVGHLEPFRAFLNPTITWLSRHNPRHTHGCPSYMRCQSHTFMPSHGISGVLLVNTMDSIPARTFSSNLQCLVVGLAKSLIVVIVRTCVSPCATSNTWVQSRPWHYATEWRRHLQCYLVLAHFAACCAQATPQTPSLGHCIFTPFIL